MGVCTSSNSALPSRDGSESLSVSDTVEYEGECLPRLHSDCCCLTMYVDTFDGDPHMISRHMLHLPVVQGNHAKLRELTRILFYLRRLHVFEHPIVQRFFVSQLRLYFLTHINAALPPMVSALVLEYVNAWDAKIYIPFLAKTFRMLCVPSS